ncbi:MAG: UPF0158 family protein [candidate division WOR-3 bacterium]
MRTLVVSERDLFFALTNQLPGTTHYLDLETGEVIPVFGHNREIILERVRREPDRLLRLAPQSGRRGYETMTEFTRTISQQALRSRLETALAGERPFRRFREVLRELPVEQRRWQQFRALVTTRVLREKLTALGIELEIASDDAGSDEEQLISG